MSLKFVCSLALLACSSLVDAGIFEGKPAKKAKKPTLKDYHEGKAKEASDKAAVAARDSKLGAVNKVIDMLEGLQQKVVAEGEQEGKSYLEFSRFCETMTKKKTKAIAHEKDEKTGDQTQIKSLTVERKKLSAKIAANDKKIKGLKTAAATSKEASDKAFALNEMNSADLISAISGVTEAVKVMKAGKSASLLQVQSVSSTVDTALMLADALGLSSKQSVVDAQSFLQKPAVEMENYKHHSSGIIEMLEKLRTAFSDQKNKLDADEAKRVGAYNLNKQRNTDLTTKETKDLDDNKEQMDSATAEQGSETQELSTVSSELEDDREFLKELQAGCTAKKNTFNQRTALRKKELAAITKATDIVKGAVRAKTSAATVRLAEVGSSLHIADAIAQDDESMEALESEAETIEANEPVGFLQKHKSVIKSHAKSVIDDRDAVITQLQDKGLDLKSTALLSLATRIKADPFAKIKGLIQDMIEKLLKEASDDANKKGLCDKQFSDANQKRDNAADNSARDNALMAKLESQSEKLNADIVKLTQDIADLKAANKEATTNRKEESAENTATIAEAKAGLAAVNSATEIISKFYKTAAKETVNFLEDESNADPFANAPDAGFKNGQAYKGAAGSSGGIVGMMEVIASDFTRTIAATTADEKTSKDEHREFMTVSLSSLAEKQMALGQKTKYRDEAQDKLSDAEDSLNKETKILAGAIKELIVIDFDCNQKGNQGAADRKAKREDEIASLQDALKKFENNDE